MRKALSSRNLFYLLNIIAGIFIGVIQLSFHQELSLFYSIISMTGIVGILFCMSECAEHRLATTLIVLINVCLSFQLSYAAVTELPDEYWTLMFSGLTVVLTVSLVISTILPQEQ